MGFALISGCVKKPTLHLCAVACLTGSALHAADLGVIEIVAPAQSSSTPFEIGDVPAGEFTGVHEVIEKEELQQAGSSLAEVVAESSGVQFRQSGGIGSFSTVSLRGSTAEQVNVYLDGILLNEASGGGVNLSHIELMQADRVEVYRGAVPVQLGNSAIGGAVNITSNRATATPATRFLAGFGSFGSARVSASYTGPLAFLNEQRLVASFSHRQSNNNFSFVNDNGTVFNTADDEEQQRNNAATQSTSGFLKSGFTLSGGSRLEQALQIDSHGQEIADWRNTVRGNASLGTDSLQWRSTLSRTAGTGYWSSRWGAHYSAKDELFDDSRGSIGLGNQQILSNTRVVGGRSYWEKLEDGRSISVNIKGRYETLDTENRLIASSKTTARRTRADINVQWNRYYSGGDSLFSVGVFGFLLNDSYETSNAQLQREDYTAESFTPQAGISHYLGERLGGTATVVANASLQKRPPSFFELFGSQGFFEGNPALATEASTNVDVGIKWQSDASHKIDSTVQLVWFYHRKKNLISRVYDSRGVGRSENISAATGNGLEFSGRFALENGLAIDANLTLQDTENRSAISGFTGKQLPGEAAIDGALGFSWKNPQWKVGYTYKLNANRYYDSPNLLPAADQKIHSASVSRYFKQWRVDFELNNIGNHIYEDFNGYPKPGRAGFISLTYQP